MKIVTSGYPSMDRIIKVSQTPTVGQTSVVLNKDNTKVNFGGCSPNIAYNLSKLGIDASPIMRVGSDFESIGYKEFLQSGGVNLQYVKEISQDVTSLCYLLSDPDMEHTTVFYPGAQSEEYFEELPDEMFENADYGVLTVGCYKDNVEFVRKCKERNVPLVFGMRTDKTAFPDDFLKEILTTAEIIFMNRLESEFIKELMGLSDVSELFDIGNAKIVVTTYGKKGSRCYTKDSRNTDMIPIYECEVVDGTGTGDAYISGFLFGMTEKRTLQECCMLGTVLSSFAVQKIGCCTNAPTREALYERFEKFKTELTKE